MKIIGGEHDLAKVLSVNDLKVSVLTWHIVSYLKKWKMPSLKLKRLHDVITSIEMDNVIVNKAMAGPTDDFEDNVQLHSAVIGDCDYFLTIDKKLLKMKFFGKMRICDKFK